MIILNKLLWAMVTAVIILTGISFSLKLKFPQLKWKRILKSIHYESSNDISVLDTLMMSLSSRIGVGSIAGIAIAIKYGGIGSIFWIWSITILISSISFLESYYGAKYKTKIDDHTYVGGPHHYIKKVLKKEKLAIIYALLMVISYGIGFITIQTNTISTMTSISLNFNHHIVNVIILLTAIYCLCSNMKKKSELISRVVPFMTILYLILGLWIIINHFYDILLIVKNICFEALKFDSLKGGMLYSLIVGMQRAIFSTEVSIGTSAMASSMTKSDSQNQGYVEILGNYITTFIICTITALIILSSNYSDYINSSSNGIELAYFAFEYHFGNIGKIFILLFIILFAYSTILSGFYYGETSLSFLTTNNFFKRLYKLIVIAFIFISTYVSATNIWTIIDIFVGLLCLINIYAITKIYKIENN